VGTRAVGAAPGAVLGRAKRAATLRLKWANGDAVVLCRDRDGGCVRVGTRIAHRCVDALLLLLLLRA